METVSDYLPENEPVKSKCMNPECGKFAVEYMTCTACGMLHDPDYDYNELENGNENDNRMLPMQNNQKRGLDLEFN